MEKGRAYLIMKRSMIKRKGLRSDTLLNNPLPPTSDTLTNYEKKTC